MVQHADRIAEVLASVSEWDLVASALMECNVGKMFEPVPGHSQRLGCRIDTMEQAHLRRDKFGPATCSTSEIKALRLFSQLIEWKERKILSKEPLLLLAR